VADGRRARWAQRVRPARLAEGAALGLLTWAAALALGIPRLVGLVGPLGLALGAGVGALFGGLAPRAGRALAVAVAALYAVVAYSPLAATLLPRVVRRDRVSPPPAVDAVAVLSSGVGTDGLIRDQGLERLLAGSAWARALDRPIVVSIVRMPGRSRAVSSAADQRAVLALAGVARVYYVDSVSVTRDEAVREAALARARGWRRLLVVTSASHTRRACAAYERAGIAVVCVPAPSRTYALAGPFPIDGPGERVAAFRDWLYEAVGWAVYRARGWV
jgi:uncharacterized SAM-binding protein YcdF (DUF218 family)